MLTPDLTLSVRSCPQTALLRWFLVFTKPASEQLAEANLLRQGYGAYFPRLCAPARYRGRWIDRVVALFPRYLFVQLDIARQSLAPVRSTVGVASVVRFGVEATTVPDAIVDSLKCKADPETGLHRLRDRPLRHGVPVSVIGGTFEGLEGIFDRDTGDARAVILLSVLGGSTPVCVKSGYLVPALAR